MIHLKQDIKKCAIQCEDYQYSKLVFVLFTLNKIISNKIKLISKIIKIRLITIMNAFHIIYIYFLNQGWNKIIKFMQKQVL